MNLVMDNKHLKYSVFQFKSDGAGCPHPLCRVPTQVWKVRKSMEKAFSNFQVLKSMENEK